MAETLYAERPDVYDALYADKDYDGEVAFVAEQFEARGNGGNRALMVGCGTGEHARRLVERGFDVTGVDRYEAMVERARTKSEATFRVGSLPDLPVDGPFDLVWLPFTVVNHLPADAFAPSLAAVRETLADGGVLAFDRSDFGRSPDHPTFRVHDRPDGSYARLVQVRSVGERRYRWESLVFAPDGTVFVDTHELTNYDPAFLTGALEVQGYAVESYDGYDASADGESVFLAVA